MTDSEKLRTVADWFDKCHAGSGNEVQRDLRRIATQLETNVTQQIQNAASTMLRACRETGNCQMSLVLRDKDEKPVAGVFCVADAALAEIIDNIVTQYEGKQKAATQNISETLGK
jgi:Ethanolamine utilization protein EutJ (predicted chaperonin)